MPIRTLIDSEQVTEVVVNGHDSVFFEESGRLHRSDAAFSHPRDLEVLLNLLAQNAGRVLQPGDFELDTAVAGPPALRVHANFGATSPQGVCLTFRRIAQKKLTLQELIGRLGTMSEPAGDFLRLAIRSRKNVLISGGTGSGKTTLLRCLGNTLPAEERIVLIEDTAELEFSQPNVVSLLTRGPDAYGEGEVSMRDLFRSSLRLRPDRIIIGEVRGPEAFDLIQALSSGHSGSLCTIHSETPYLALTRLEGLAMGSGAGTPVAALHHQISQVLHYALQVNRDPDGARRVEEISRINESPGQEWNLSPLFSRQQSSRDSERRLEWLKASDAWLASVPTDIIALDYPSLARVMATGLPRE